MRALRRGKDGNTKDSSGERWIIVGIVTAIFGKGLKREGE